MFRDRSVAVNTAVILFLLVPLAEAQTPVEVRLSRDVESLKTSVKEQNGKVDSLGSKVENVEKRTAGTETAVRQAQDGVQDLNNKLTDLRTNAGVTRRDLDRFWVLLAAVLVFFMQAGFKSLEVGMSRRRYGPTMGVMNLMNWLVLCIVFYAWGFGLMFGHSLSGIVGVDLFFPSAEQVEKAYSPLGLEYLLFQLAFAATAATIVDGALAERTSLIPYLTATCLAGSLVYPIFGHWAWNDAGWLKHIGPYEFHDFAGSTVVHSVGAWISLIGVRFVGPRRFRFSGGSQTEFAPYNLGYAVLGVIMLWFGWWGFNGGSRLKYDASIASIILNTNLAGASAGLASFVQAHLFGKSSVYEKTIGGVLGGLVAITASCDVVNPLGALAVGTTAGVVHNWAYDLLLRRRIDDVAGAIPVHGACGVWGTLCTGFAIWWGQQGGNPAQVLVQLLGIVSAFLYTGSVSWVIFSLVERWMGLRIPLVEEDGGRMDPLLGDYEGRLRVTVRRGIAWSRFRTFTEYMRSVQMQSPAPRQARQEVTNELRTGNLHFIRDDDTEATERDVVAALDGYFN